MTGQEREKYVQYRLYKDDGRQNNITEKDKTLVVWKNE